MTDGSNQLNFSQRNGLEPVPEQLKHEQVSGQFRRLIHYALDQEINRVSHYGHYFTGEWLTFTQDFHVKFLEQPIYSYPPFHHVAQLRFDKLFVTAHPVTRPDHIA